MTISTASFLYASSQGSKNTSGPYQCHWCGAMCGSFMRHDDSLSREIGIPFSRNGAKHPGNPYVCTGCWLWQRKRITIHYYHPEPVTSGMPLGLGSTITLKDSQAPRNHSWWITEEGAWCITPNNGLILQKALLTPPLRFTLMLLEGIDQINHLHKAILNDLPEIKADTPLGFTINNIPHTYTVYELEQAIKNGPECKSPGINSLFKILNLHTEKPPISDDDDLCFDKQPVKNPVGRPILQKVADYKKIIRKL